ncbi:SWIM zinc finger family protein [Nonomuraea sp. NPDC050536]|uniref:SWIM zinc finger family protein n=1 Tax=Nonomuraea sp. NPDC050536 TaxID=3364366 RepID=UPI0037C928D9
MTHEGPSPAQRPGETARHARVAAGLVELERWLGDQVRHGIAGADRRAWDELAKRLVDAQASGVAGVVSRLERVRSFEGWPERLLAEYALLNLLAVAFRRRAELPEPLARTVLSRVGFPTSREEVLAGPAVRDHWHVLALRDEDQDPLVVRRVWLHGHGTGRPALILTFTPPGQRPDDSLVPGTVIDAALAFYPGAAPLRAIVVPAASPEFQPFEGAPAAGSPRSPGGEVGFEEPPGVSVAEGLAQVGGVLAADPWIESWPLVLRDVVPEAEMLGGLPLHPRDREPWRLIAVAGGRPVTVAVDWTPAGLRPLATWADDGTAVPL